MRLDSGLRLPFFVCYRYFGFGFALGFCQHVAQRHVSTQPSTWIYIC